MVTKVNDLREHAMTAQHRVVRVVQMQYNNIDRTGQGVSMT